MKITPKQERWCREYVIDLNATQAAVRAGYSERSANSAGNGNKGKPCLRDRVAQLQAEMANRLNVSADNVVRELAACGFANIQDYLDEFGKFKPVYELTREQAAAIQESKITATKAGTVTTVLKLVDKRASLVDLGKHLGIFEADNSQKGAADALNAKPEANLAAARMIAFALRAATEQEQDPPALN